MQDARALLRAGPAGSGVGGAAVLDDGQADEIGRLEQAEVEHDRGDAEPIGDLAHDLALADAGRALEQHGAARAVGELEHRLEAGADGDGRGTGLGGRGWLGHDPGGLARGARAVPEEDGRAARVPCVPRTRTSGSASAGMVPVTIVRKTYTSVPANSAF